MVLDVDAVYFDNFYHDVSHGTAFHWRGRSRSSHEMEVLLCSRSHAGEYGSHRFLLSHAKFGLNINQFLFASRPITFLELFCVTLLFSAGGARLFGRAEFRALHAWKEHGHGEFRRCVA